MKLIKIIFLVLFLIILGYILFPKNIGFVGKTRSSTGEVVTAVTTTGKYNMCLGVTLSEEKGDRIFLRCIGIPLYNMKITI